MSHSQKTSTPRWDHVPISYWVWDHETHDRLVEDVGGDRSHQFFGVRQRILNSGVDGKAPAQVCVSTSTGLSIMFQVLVSWPSLTTLRPKLVAEGQALVHVGAIHYSLVNYSV